eukprot:s4520_g2.t1
MTIHERRTGHPGQFPVLRFLGRLSNQVAMRVRTHIKLAGSRVSNWRIRQLLAIFMESFHGRQASNNGS